MSDGPGRAPRPPAALLVPPGRIVALQGLRGAAVAMVVVSHVIPLTGSSIALGVMGVTVFFTLSGFLITGVLIDPRSKGLRGLGEFYAARAVRLFPALLALVLATGAGWILSGRPLPVFAGYATTSLLYVENFFAAQHDQQILAHTWSLAVEEQFYLVWPIVLVPILVARTRIRLILIGVLIVASLSLRFGLFRLGFGHEAYSSLPSNAYALLLGCALRLLPLQHRVPGWIAGGGLAGIAVLSIVGGFLPAPTVVTPALAAVLAVMVIAGALGGNGLLDSRLLVFLGSISYAWYLWHWPVLWLTGTVHTLGDAVLPAGISLVIATLSTYLLEDPLRRLAKTRLFPPRGGRKGVVLSD